MLYLLDSSAIITPLYAGVLGSLTLGLQSRYPAVIQDPLQARTWLEEWFTRGFKAGHLVGSDELLEEVKRKKDRASRLLQDLNKQGLVQILAPTPDSFSYIADIDRFVRTNFEPHYAEPFLKTADPAFIALAKTHEATLITIESHNIPEYNPRQGKVQGQPHIPFVAWAFGVRCISLYQAFQELP